jgi:uncharacterized protein DUF4336
VPAYSAYLPLNTLKPVAEDVWIVDGPEIDMRYLGTRFPFPTRMTVVRLPSKAIWIHSPVAWRAELGEAVGKLGPITCLVAPSTLHYWFLPDWREQFPKARSYGPPGLERRARRKVRIDHDLGASAPAEWGGTIDQCVVTGRLFTEIDFFHRPSRTLILTDLIENFEPERIQKRWLRLAIRLSGAADPDGKAPYDMQWSFIGRRRELREAVKQMIAWAPERIIIAHGRCYMRDGVAELKRAFRWALA